MTFTHLMWAVFSILFQTHFNQCVASGGLSQNYLPPWGLSISYQFCGIHGIEIVTFPHFIAISGLGTLDLSFIEGDSLRYKIRALALIVYQKLPPFLELAFSFANFHKRVLPWANGLHARPRILIAPHWSQLQLSWGFILIAWSF